MIINTGARTDTVQYFSKWLLNRFAEGYVLARNPLFPNKVTRYELTPIKLAGHVDRCIFSFVEMYKKLQFNMPELIPLSEEDKNILAEGLGRTASRLGIFIQTCGMNGDFSRYGIHPSGCVTLEMLGKANGISFRNLKHNGTRAGCRCIESRDIGAYDTCLNGCKYCYANQSPQKAFENYKFHNENSPLLLGSLKQTDTVIQGSQKSYLSKDQPQQMELNI